MIAFLCIFSLLCDSVGNDINAIICFINKSSLIQGYIKFLINAYVQWSLSQVVYHEHLVRVRFYRLFYQLLTFLFQNIEVQLGVTVTISFLRWVLEQIFHALD